MMLSAFLNTITKESCFIMELNLMEWNINFGADKNAKIAEFAKNYVDGADIIILTEAIHNDSIDKFVDSLSFGYELYESKASGETWYNQVLILIKNELKDKLVIKEIEIDETKWNKKELPDIMHVSISNNDGAILNVIGTRVRIDVFNNDEIDYKNRCKQFSLLVKYLNTLDNVLVMGDFNNGMIKASSDALYSDVKEKYETRWDKNKRKYVKSLLRFYNFHMMRDILGTDYIMSETFGEDSSWGLSLYNNDFSYGLIKNDQIITKGVKLYESGYDWNYVRDNELSYSDMLFRNRYKKGNKICHGFPDHAILRGKVII